MKKNGIRASDKTACAPTQKIYDSAQKKVDKHSFFDFRCRIFATDSLTDSRPHTPTPPRCLRAQRGRSPHGQPAAKHSFLTGLLYTHCPQPAHCIHGPHTGHEPKHTERRHTTATAGITTRQASACTPHPHGPHTNHEPEHTERRIRHSHGRHYHPTQPAHCTPTGRIRAMSRNIRSGGHTTATAGTAPHDIATAPPPSAAGRGRDVKM